MSATGHAESDDIHNCEQGTLLVKCLRQNDKVLLTGPDSLLDRWHVSRRRLRSVSHFLDLELQNPSTKAVYSPYLRTSAVELFLQWLYTSRYQEHDCFTMRLDANDTETFNSLQQVQHCPQNGIIWRVKAAFLSCQLGVCLIAPAFHNYAMERLFQAYSQDTLKATLGTDVFRSLSVGVYCAELRLFFEDLAIRNWGDVSVVDHNDPEWSRQLAEHEGFRNKFVRAVGTTLEKRREEPMDLAKYLLTEEEVKMTSSNSIP